MQQIKNLQVIVLFIYIRVLMKGSRKGGEEVNMTRVALEVLSIKVHPPHPHYTNDLNRVDRVQQLSESIHVSVISICCVL
jgi:hypothetical protein